MKEIFLIEPNINHQQLILKLINNGELSAKTLKYDFSAKFLLKSILPSLIIIGCGVPDSNTFDLVNYLKSDPIYSKIKILKLCPENNKFKNIKFIQEGVDDIINLTEISLFIFLDKITKLIGDFEEKPTVKPETRPAAKLIEVEFPKATIIGESQDNKQEKVYFFNSHTNKTLDDQGLILDPKNLQKRLAKALQARAIPFVASEILNLTSSLNSDIKELIKMIKLDPALTIKILRCANSSCYRGNMPRISNVSDSVKTIGMSGLKNLVLGISILDSFQQDVLDNNKFKIWYHSIVTAVITREIAKKIHIEDVDSIFIMGILHDIGTSIFAEYCSKEYNQVFDIVYERQLPLHKVEKKLLGSDHGQVASHILESWGFSKSTTIPISNHNESIKKILETNSVYKKETAILKLADLLANNLGYGISSFEEVLDIPNELLVFLGLKGSDLNTILIDVMELTNELIQVLFMHLDPSSFIKCDDLNEFKSLKKEPVAFYSYKSKPNDYSSYATILNQLNFDVIVPRNPYSIPNLGNFKYTMIDFSNACSLTDCVDFLKILKNEYGKTLRLCVLASEEMQNSIYNCNDLPPHFTYLKKPLCLKDLAIVTQKMCC